MVLRGMVKFSASVFGPVSFDIQVLNEIFLR